MDRASIEARIRCCNRSQSHLCGGEKNTGMQSKKKCVFFPFLLISEKVQASKSVLLQRHGKLIRAAESERKKVERMKNILRLPLHY